MKKTVLLFFLPALFLLSACGASLVKGAENVEVYKEKDGDVVVVGGSEWPENALTELVPNPGFPVSSYRLEDDEVEIFFEPGISVEDVRAYAEELRAAGFDRDVELTDTAAQGNAVFSFSAENRRGVDAELELFNGVASLQIER